MADELDERSARRRRNAARQVVRALRQRDFHTVLPAGDAGEPLPIVVALPEDSVGSLFEEVRRHTSRTQLLAVPRGRNAIAIVQMTVTRGASRDADPCSIHPDSEIGMMLDLLTETHRPMTCRVVDPQWRFELIEDGTPATA